MAPEIYERLFLYARHFEKYFAGDASFQYIVTTTASPPADLQNPPWIVQPLLDTSKPKGQLLGVDL